MRARASKSAQAGSWARKRRIIHKAEHTDKGPNPRFVVTNLPDPPAQIYQRYCLRGEMENKIKEQMMLFSDRTSAHCWWANQWRVLLSAACPFKELFTNCAAQLRPT